jgi:hypothetical protein
MRRRGGFPSPRLHTSEMLFKPRTHPLSLFLLFLLLLLFILYSLFFLLRAVPLEEVKIKIKNKE